MDPTSVAPKPKPKPTETTSKAPAPKPTTKPITTTSKRTSSSATTVTTVTSGTSSPSPLAQPEIDAKGGLPTSAIAGIAAGSLIILFILSVIICKKRRAHQYAKRNFGYDPSRDPIDPNEVYPSENKFSQIAPSTQDDSGFISYPLSVRGADRDTKPDLPDTNLNQRTQQNEYQHYEDHIQSHFSPESPQLANRGPVVSAGVSSSRAHPPAPLSTNQFINSPPMLPSQRAQFHGQQQNSQGPMSPLSPRLHLPLDTRSGQDTKVFNDMGNQFVLQSNNDSSGHQNMEHGRHNQDGSIIQSELSYHKTPRKSQESSVVGVGGHNPSSQPGRYYNHSESPSTQQRGGRTGHNGGSPYSSQHSGPSPLSPRSQPLQYQPQQQQQQQQYSQYPSPGPVYNPQQHSSYPSEGPVRSPPVGPRGPGYSEPNPNY
ncbi:hypothetical protein BGX27_008080 [Mortierella sp. AM989]|nr:hypothetical protein BGX27_008080 [Mortierella sp. AM989]